MRFPFQTILAVRERLEVEAVAALNFGPSPADNRLAARVGRVMRWMGDDLWRKTTEAYLLPPAATRKRRQRLASHELH